MLKLSRRAIDLFQKQGFAIFSTIDENGNPHSSCKDIIEVAEDGRIYLLDLYRARSFKNLQNNPRASLTVVDEHKFQGFCLKGKAQIVEVKKLDSEVIKKWEDKITSRTTQRVIKNLRGEKGHPSHPEAQLPKPQYMIYMKVEEIVDLTPHKLRQHSL